MTSTSTSGGTNRTRRRPVTAAGSRGIGQATQRGSMALPSGTGLGIGGGMGLRNRPGWEADEVVSNLRASGLEGMSRSHTADRSRHGVSSLSLSLARVMSLVPKDTFRV